MEPVKVKDVEEYADSIMRCRVHKGELIFTQPKDEELLDSTLWLKEDGRIFQNPFESPILLAQDYEPLTLAIISSTEIVDPDDLAYHPDKGVFTCPNLFWAIRDKTKKVLATHENFSPRDIKRVVNGIINHKSEVYIKCTWDSDGWLDPQLYMIQQDSNNHVALFLPTENSIKDKEEEISNAYKEFCSKLYPIEQGVDPAWEAWKEAIKWYKAKTEKSQV